MSGEFLTENTVGEFLSGEFFWEFLAENPVGEFLTERGEFLSGEFLSGEFLSGEVLAGRVFVRTPQATTPSLALFIPPSSPPPCSNYPFPIHLLPNLFPNPISQPIPHLFNLQPPPHPPPPQPIPHLLNLQPPPHPPPPQPIPQPYSPTLFHNPIPQPYSTSLFPNPIPQPPPPQ